MRQRALEDDLLATWGDYEIWDVLGRGGAGTVVRALAPPRTNYPAVVALKFLHGSLEEDPKAIAAFHAEAALGKQLRHPNIVRTFGLEHHDERSAIVMEYVDGQPLHRFHRTLPVPVPAHEPYMLTALVAQVCDALEALHSIRGADGSLRKVVHRDVTPQNVLVRGDGVVKLLDCGVFFSPDRGFHTTAGFLKGKVPYLAPEYIEAQPWDHRVDIWAAGVMAWELFTGKHLFLSSSPGQTMTAVRYGVIPHPSKLRPELSFRLGAVVMKALERNPRRRYSSARDFADALRAVTRAEYRRIEPAMIAEWIASSARAPASGVMQVARRLNHDSDPKHWETLTFDSELTG